MCCGRKRPKKKNRPRGTKSGRIPQKEIQSQQQEQVKNEQRPENSK